MLNIMQRTAPLGDLVHNTLFFNNPLQGPPASVSAGWKTVVFCWICIKFPAMPCHAESFLLLNENIDTAH